VDLREFLAGARAQEHARTARLARPQARLSVFEAQVFNRQVFPANLEMIEVAQHREGDLPAVEERPRDLLDLAALTASCSPLVRPG